ncbi:MAG TPA: hypothetical protein VK922_05310 [Gemmatimonadaceae bacterium]|nr:hypothetical protein [Gemmatimonadaceae bacterium]
MRTRSSVLMTFAAGLLVTSCSRTPPSSDDTSLAAGDTVPAPRDLQAEVTRLEARLRNIATSDGCDSAAHCKTVPVGERACGGPREYVVYCATATDEAALLAVADSLKQAETRLNEATGAVSTCEFRMPPDVAVEAGRCVGKRE